MQLGKQAIPDRHKSLVAEQSSEEDRTSQVSRLGGHGQRQTSGSDGIWHTQRGSSPSHR